MENTLKGKTAIVTGGSRGIGFAITKELLDQGVTNVFICSRSKEQLEIAVDRLKRGRGKVYSLIADVSKFKDCQKLINFAYSKTGRIDVLVNNAGIYGPVGLLETNDPEGWLEILKINILGTVHCSKLAIPYMKRKKGGKIINLSGAGVGGPKALPRFAGYYTSKAAIAAFTETLAQELESENIQVNAIAPGGVATDLNLNLLKLKKSQLGEDMYKMAKLLKQKGGTPPELSAKLVAFLASKESDHISGCILSAKWDSIELLKKVKPLNKNLYRLRRIDGKNFVEKKQ
mgnify:CR=1 FL=1